MTQAPTAADSDPATDAPQPAGPADVEVQEAEFGEVSDPGIRGGTGQIDILLDTTVEITATLGSTRLAVGELLEMGPGSVLKLDRAAGEPVDLYLNGARFATGILVVVGNQLGVRVREVLAQESEEESPASES